MAYGTIYSDTIQGSTANTAPVFNDGNSREIGQLCKAWLQVGDRKSTRLNSSHSQQSRMPSSA